MTSRMTVIVALAGLAAGLLAAAHALAGPSGNDVRVNTDDLQGSHQNETTIAECTGQLVAAWNEDPGGVGFASSDDEGASWADGGTVPYPLNGSVGGDPILTADGDCNFYLAMITSDYNLGGAIGVAKSSDGGRTFSRPQRAGLGLLPAGFQDKPWIAADVTGGSHEGNLYLCWTEYGAPVNPVLFTRSTDGGLTWEPARTMTAPNRFGSECQLAVGSDGEVYVAWVDPFPPAIRIRRSDDGGATFGPDRVAGSWQPAGHLVDCGGQIRLVKDGNIRIFGTPSMAVDPSSGRVYVAWHDSRLDESDILVARSEDRGEHWSNPLRVNDDATDTDQFMPAVAVNPDGVVMVMWYDRRLDPANRNLDVFAALSLDGGVSFMPNQRITDASSGIKSHTSYSCYMGDYNGLVGTAAAFHLVWGDNRNLDQYGEPQADVFSERFTAPQAPPPIPPATPAPTATPMPTPDGEAHHDLAVTDVTVPSKVTVDVSQGAVTIPVSMSIENQGDHQEGSPDMLADGAISGLVMLGGPDGCYPRRGLATLRTLFVVAVTDTDLAPGESRTSLDTEVELTCGEHVLSGDYTIIWLGVAARYEHGDVITLALEFHDAEPADNSRFAGTTLHVISPTVAGDANCDGRVTSTDASIVLQYTAGLYFKLCHDLADVDRNGGVTPLDAVLILQYVAGLLEHLPP